MKVEMHIIKGGQLGYYRQPLEELGESVKEVRQGLNELETALSSITSEYAINAMESLINDVSTRLESMLEVYTLRSENPSISDSEFLEMALNKREEFKERMKRIGKARHK